MSLRQQFFRWYTEWVTPPATDIPFQPPSIPVSARAVALVTTAGIRLKDQAAFDTERGDASFREIPGTTDVANLVPDHTHYDTAAAGADLDCIFPLRTLREMAAQGAVRGLAGAHFGFMGYIPDLHDLVNRSIPSLLERLQATGAGVVLLSPG